MTGTTATTSPIASAAVTRRLRPLQVGIALQNLLFWVPVEKIFMIEIGFDATSIAVVAAVYAAVVPLLEVPSGMLADRWSRSGVMVLATLALAACSLVAGLSTDPAMYAVSAALLGVFFALNSGTADSIVYDTLVEETGSSDGYEKWIGRLQLVEAAALIVSALTGGLLAAVVSARFTYFATVPVVVAATWAFGRCREPMLHRASERVAYRRQAVATLHALGASGAVRRVVLLSATAAVTAQVLFEFGPLWLVRLHAPAVLYGPYWAALISALGLGAWMASRIRFARASVTVLLAAALLLASVLPVVVASLPVVVAAQVVLALIATGLGVRAGFLLHEAVDASVRAGVSSGAGTLSWILFLPVSLLFGWISRSHGLPTAGWLIVLIAVGLAGLSRAAGGGPARG